MELVTDGLFSSDDTPDIFKTRLELFKANGLPMLKYLDDKGRLRVVRGWDKQVMTSSVEEQSPPGKSIIPFTKINIQPPAFVSVPVSYP